MLLAIVLTATVACQTDSVVAPDVTDSRALLGARVGDAAAAFTVVVGDSVRLTHPFQPATLQAQGASFAWRSSDSTVLRINGDGLAHGLAPGSVTAEAALCTTHGGGKKGRGRIQTTCQTHALSVRVDQAPPGVSTPADSTPADSTPPDSVTTDPAPVDSSPTPPPTIPQGSIPRGVDGVRWLAGPIPPPTVPRASGWTVGRLMHSELDTYDAQFAKYAEYHWKSSGANWEQANYYDRAAMYYAWWARTGKNVYLERANALALDYRTKYLEAQSHEQKYNSAGYWHMPMGVALHYLVTGDEKSRTAVGYSAEWVGAQHLVNTIGAKKTMRLPESARRQSPIGASLSDPITVGDAENRSRARILQGFVLAHALAAPQNGPANGYGKGGMVKVLPGTWAEKAKTVLDLILAFQNPDGSYRDEQSGGAEKPFMDGLLNDALILYYQFVSPDPRIVSAVKRNLDYNWANTWLGDSFAYYEWSYTSPVDPSWAGGRYAAGDLNGLIVNGFGWVYAKTKDPTYRDRGDQVFRGIANAYLQGSKHFNQSFASSYRYLAYRVGQE